MQQHPNLNHQENMEHEHVFTWLFTGQQLHVVQATPTTVTM